MHYVAYTLVALFLAGLAAAVIAVKHAPEGYENDDGFHPGTAARQARGNSRSRRPARRNRELPALLATR